MVRGLDDHALILMNFEGFLKKIAIVFAMFLFVEPVNDEMNQLFILSSLRMRRSTL